MTDYTKLVKELRGCKYIDYCKDCPRMAANGYVEICNIKDDAADAIEALQAQLPKHGEWIYSGEQDDGHNYYCHCSVCGAGDIHAIKGTVPYCWRCGAKMTEVQDDKV